LKGLRSNKKKNHYHCKKQNVFYFGCGGLYHRYYKIANAKGLTNIIAYASILSGIQQRIGLVMHPMQLHTLQALIWHGCFDL
jgi:hypothetical protein